nr:hypothetical protein HK105_001504 [Polyrhizophydium stewartii]
MSSKELGEFVASGGGTRQERSDAWRGILATLRAVHDVGGGGGGGHSNSNGFSSVGGGGGGVGVAAAGLLDSPRDGAAGGAAAATPGAAGAGTPARGNLPDGLPRLADLVRGWEHDLHRAPGAVRSDESDMLWVFSDTTSSACLGSLVEILVMIMGGASTGAYPLATCQLAVWTLTSQRIGDAHLLGIKADDLTTTLTACMHAGDAALAEEAVRALARLCTQSHVFVLRASRWFGSVLELLFSRDAAVRASGIHDAGADVGLVTPTTTPGGTTPGGTPLGTPGMSQASASTTASRKRTPPALMADFIALLESHAHDNLNMMRAWGHVVVAFGAKLHRTQALNTLLAIIESNFNSARPGQRIGAYRAWRRIVFNFSLKGRLLLIPIWNCLRFEKSHAVRQAGFETYMYLLLHLSQTETPAKNFLDVCVMNGIEHHNSNESLHVVLMAAVANMVSGSPERATMQATFAALEESPENICYLIRRNMPASVWSRSDFDNMLRILASADTRLEQEMDSCRRIWLQACAFVQAEWDAGGERGQDAVMAATDFVAARVYVPGIVTLSFERRAPGLEDQEVLRYLASSEAILLAVQTRRPLRVAWRQFRATVAEHIDGGLEMDDDEPSDADAIDADVQVADEYAAGRHTEQRADPVDREMSPTSLLWASMPHGDSMQQVDAAEAEEQDEDDDDDLHDRHAVDARSGKRKNGPDWLSRAPKRALAGGDRRVLAGASGAAGDSGAGGGQFLAHLAGLIQHQDDLDTLAPAEVVRVQSALARLIGACCERLQP